ncbi:MAG: Cof-type HAD-IIB family hydrolase [Lachnospiraceae bacterium]|nr:Cof-type HAD-IIB family hydrolase [Lachnospiraceae bacterium]
MSRIKMLGLDLDGTLFTDDKKITKTNRKAIRKALEKGVVVLPATGRPLNGVPEELMEFEGIDYVLTSNGAAVYKKDSQKVIYSDYMNKDTVVRILQKAQTLPLMYDVFMNGKGYVEKEIFEAGIPHIENPEIISYFYKSRVMVKDLIEHIQTSPYGVEKITLNFRRNPNDCSILLGRQEMIEALSSYADISVVSGVPTNLEITNATAKKGTALIELGKLLGIKREEIMACGDSGNDKEMLETVGLGVAMANAEAAVKEVADYITVSNGEDGVAKAIAKFILT